MAFMTQFGSALGAVAGGMLMSGRMVMEAYAVLAITLLVVGIGTFVGLPEIPLTTARPKFSWKQHFASLWIDPKKYPDFAWVWITRALVMLGFYTVQPFVVYYLRDVIKAEDPEKVAQYLFLLILIGATISGLVGGYLSDRVGRKKIVYIANSIMAVMTVALVFCNTLPQALAVGVLFGLGYGAYISVDWALGTDVLPNKADAGKDMAVWHISMVLPQSIAAPLAGVFLNMFAAPATQGPDGPVYHYTQSGYMVIFSMAAAFLILGAVLLRNVRGAR